MTALDFVVLTLAASAVVDVWLNGSLFADWRAFFQTPPSTPLAEPVSDDAPAAHQETPLPRLMRIADRVLPRFVAEILGCAFCFSHHTPWIVGVVCFWPATWLASPLWLIFLLKLPAYSLAATRLGNLINAWAPPSAKYDKHD